MKRTLLLGLLLTLLAFPLVGHETSLSLSHTQIQPGNRVEVRGAGLSSNAPIKLALEGVLETYSLGEVQGNAHGQFLVEVVIPLEVKPGSYTLKAQAGPTAASSPLKVLNQAVSMANEEKPETVTQEQKSTRPGLGGEGRTEDRASLEPLQLDRSWSPSEMATVWGLIVVAALFGSFLWFKR